ncbi:MAG: hypothetical protein D6730_22430 [Bacteroidetes bacterium]|nr:MAG: hypothetical protein D6730_22430 [Bacteroidota bacterium]
MAVLIKKYIGGLLSLNGLVADESQTNWNEAAQVLMEVLKYTLLILAAFALTALLAHFDINIFAD